MADIYAVASGTRGVGKTTTVAALGRTLAEAGRDVLLVDFDLTDPELSTRFGDATPNGAVYDVLAGDGDVDDAVHIEEGLALLSGDPTVDAATPVDPSGLHALVEAVEGFDDVFVDTGRPAAPETGVALDVADGVVVVSTPDRVALREAQFLYDRIERRGATPLGTVLTRTGTDTPGAWDGSRPLLGRVPEVDGSAATPPAGPAGTAYRRLAATVTGRSPTADDARPAESVASATGDPDRGSDPETETGATSTHPTRTVSEFAAAEDANLTLSRRIVLTLLVGVAGALSAGVLGVDDDDVEEVADSAPDVVEDVTDRVPNIDGFGYGGTPTTAEPTATDEEAVTTESTSTPTATPTVTPTSTSNDPATQPSTATAESTATPTPTPTATPTPTPTATPTTESSEGGGISGGGGGGGGGGSSTVQRQEDATATPTPTPTPTPTQTPTDDGDVDDYGEIGYGEGGYGGTV